MIKPSAKGFSAIEALVVVLIVAALGIGGWFVWHKTRGQNTQSHPSQTSQTGNKKSETTDPSEGGTYLVIKEWGVRFLVPEDLRGKAFYTLASDKENTVIVDSHEFKEGAECVSFRLTRTKDHITNPVDPNGFDSSSFVQIGDSYFSRVVGAIACSNDHSVQERAATVQKEFYQATLSLKAIN